MSSIWILQFNILCHINYMYSAIFLDIHFLMKASIAEKTHTKYVFLIFLMNLSYVNVMLWAEKKNKEILKR